MPGISFLFKKRFHPSRLDNQKRVFVTEENKKKHIEKEQELAAQVAKEQELQMYEGLGKAPELDPRNASLKFMYHAPAALTKSNNSNSSAQGEKNAPKVDLLAKEAPVPLDENGDDEHVRAFRAKFVVTKDDSLDKGDEQHIIFGPLPPPPPSEDAIDVDAGGSIEPLDGIADSSDKVDKSQPVVPTHYLQSTLEQAIGRKKQAILTAEEQQERHPILKNAPIEGVYAKQAAVKHKPFNAVIRNVRCLRCGEWGHCSGDRECVLRDHNPLDFDRQMREDPMAQSRNNFHHLTSRISTGTSAKSRNVSEGQSNKNKGSGVSSAQARQYFYGGGDDDGVGSSSGNGYESSDPEGDFLRTLTRREKKLLLRKLNSLHRPEDNHADHSSSSSNDSSSSDSDDSDSDNSESSRSAHRHRKRKRKHKRSRHRHDKKQHKSKKKKREE
jgi:hypothetical protein